MKPNKCLLFLVLISAILSPPLLGQDSNNSVLRVLVTSEEEGIPIIRAHVVLFDTTESGEPGEIVKAGITDNDGFHEFRNIQTGDYILRVTYVGHTPFEEKITVEADEPRVIRATLPRSVEQFEEVVVEARREFTTGEAGVHRITDIEVARIPTPGSGGDLASYLQTLPGIVTTGDRGGELFVRGGTPEQNRVFIDHLPIIKPFHISNLYSAFPENTIQNIDVYAGGFPAEYMGATSAIIDVSMRPGNMRNTTGSAAIGPYVTSVHLEGPIEIDRKSFMLMGRKSTIKWAAPRISKDEVPINFYDIMGRYSFQDNTFTCNVTGLRTGDNGRINPERDVRLSWSNTVIGARCLGYDKIYPHPFEFTIGYSGFRNEEKSADEVERSSRYNQVYINIDHQEEIFRHLFDYGFEIKFNIINTELADRFTDFESVSVIKPIFSTFISTDWQLHPRLTVQTGLASQMAFGNVPTIEPRLRMSYDLGGDSKRELSLAAGRYYQLMTGIGDERDAGSVFKAWLPSEDENPLEHALHGIMAYRHRLGNNFRANLEGYIKKHRNIPVSRWTPEARLEIETARAEGLTYGFDVQLVYDKNPLYLFAGYGWSTVEYEAESGNLGAWIDEPVFEYSPAHDQRHKFSSVGAYTIGGFTTSLRWELGSGKPFTRVYAFDLGILIPEQDPVKDSGTARTLFSRPYDGRLPYYHRLDISVKKLFELLPGLSLEAEAGVINVYDRNNISYFDSNTLERVDQSPLLPYISLKTEFK